MKIPRILVAILLVLSLLVLQFGSVFAAPTAQGSLITGTVQNVKVETDSTTGVTTVVVTILDSTGALQTLRISVETAVSLGLVTIDSITGLPIVNPGSIGSQITIDPTTILTDTITVQQHPVGSALAEFFGELVGVDYETIMEYHEEGVGFGVIAQALWMTKKLEGDSTVFAAIVDAKKSGDYSSITLSDGTTPKNWGQFRKALLSGDKLANLGAIMSGRAGTDTQSNVHGQGHGRGHGRGRGPK
jgi:hypothetical protein